MLQRIALVLLFSAVPVTAVRAGDFETVVEPFFKQHCARCHDDRKQKGDLRLDTLTRDFINGSMLMKWGEIIERINSGEMPPKGEPKPTAEESTRVIELIAAKLKEGEAGRLAKRERVSFHKLTREEYVNTIYDLLGVHFDATDPTGLPDDPEWHGFERLGSVQSLSPSHIEKYMSAAETILAEAFPEKSPTPFLKRKEAGDLRGNPAEYKALGIADKVRVELWPGADLQGGRPGPGVALPASGNYKVRVKLSGLKPANGRAPHLAFYCVNLDRMLYETDVVAAEDKPIIVEFTTHLPAGNHNFRVTNDVPGPSNLPRSGRSGNRPFISIKDGRLPWQIKLTDEEGQPIMPFLILDSIEWEGPIVEPGPGQAKEKFWPKDAKNADEVRNSLARFAESAFRRPLRPGEIDRYTRLIDAEMKSGEKFDAAYRTGLLAVLCSKDFLYLVEGSPDDKSGKLTPWEIASRLSYFLWGTMPDELLRTAARDGSLSRPEVLREQTTRMLRDPRAERFTQSFARQWLQLRQVGMFPPDKKLYPTYDAYLEKSMLMETTAFFKEVLDKNLSLREFIDSDWTMLNARLAEHYGIRGINEDRMQRVALKPDDHRGGLLTQAAILSLTSDGTRHRPVHRGKWVLEAIVGKSPPPPPANVKPIEPTPATAPKATLRMKLDAHKSDSACASCHARIDPLGFAFDHYDAIGRWRTEEVVRDGNGDNPKVDASGELIDGRKFKDAVEFRKLFITDMDRFNAAFVEKLATFALRRTTTLNDRDRLNAIAQKSKQADYRLPAVVEALVLSDLFQQR